MDISDFLYPLSIDEWINCYWGKKIYFNNVNINQLINMELHDIVHNNLKKTIFYETNQVFLRSTDFNPSQKPTSYDEVLSGISAGLTLQVRSIENIIHVNSPLMKLVESIKKTLLLPVNSITFFQSTPNSLPTAIHKDISEIFSIQINGKKQWKIALEKDFSEQMCYQDKDIHSWNEKIFSSGDVLYLPSFLPHQVKCIHEESISIAMVFPSVPHSMLFEYFKEDPEIRSILYTPVPACGYNISEQNIEKQLSEFKRLFIKKIRYLDEKLLKDFIRHSLSSE